MIIIKYISLAKVVSKKDDEFTIFLEEEIYIYKCSFTYKKKKESISTKVNHVRYIN